MSAQYPRPPSYREATRRALETSLDAYDAFLRQAKADYPQLTQFENAADLLATLHNRAAHFSTHDAALLALIKAHAGGEGHAALALAMTAMLPALEKIHHAHARHVRDPDDLWSRIVEAFAEAVTNYPILRRPRRVAANLKGDTMNMLRHTGQLARTSKGAEKDFVAAAAPFLADIHDRNSFSLGDLAEPGPEVEATDDVEVAAAARSMATLFDASGIDGDARFLILGVHLYNRPMRELAAALGIKYKAAHQRLRRAIVRLRADAHDNAHHHVHGDAESVDEPQPPPAAGDSWLRDRASMRFRGDDLALC